MDRPRSELVLDGWRQGIRFAASHLVPHHPKCGQLHGHTYALHCCVEGPVGADGMVIDFGVVKQALRTIADELDHQWLLPREPAEGNVVVKEGEVHYDVGAKRYVVPEADVTFLDVPVVTAEHLATLVAERVLKQGAFPRGARVHLGVDEGYGKGAWVTHDL